MLRLNIGMLFFVAIEPYLFNLLGLETSSISQTYSSGGFASEAYAVDIGSIFLILGIMTYVLVKEQRKDTSNPMCSNAIRSFKYSMHAQFVAGSMFLVYAYLGSRRRQYHGCLVFQTAS